MGRSDPALRRLLLLAQALLLAGAALLFVRYLLPPLLPLALAFGLSCLIAGPAAWVKKRTGLPAGLCALLTTLILLLALAGGGWLAARLATDQLERLIAQLPALVERVQATLSALEERMTRWFPGRRGLPPVLSPDAWLDSLQPPKISLAGLAESLGWAAASLPDLALTAVFFLAATVLLVSRREEVLAFLRKQLPPRALEAARRLRSYLAGALTGWLKAQGVLAAVTFCLLLAGFLLMRLPAAAPLALALTALDALPLLGAGLALAPWALVQLLAGEYGQAAGLGLLLALLLAVRSGLEPHLVGRQIGLHPLVSLIGFYLGWQAAGVWGMFLGPIVLLVLVKLQEWGYSRLWR